MITTLQQFIIKCAGLNILGKIEDAYDVFESETSTQVREQIYELASPNASEPFRSAMFNLGFVNY